MIKNRLPSLLRHFPEGIPVASTRSYFVHQNDRKSGYRKKKDENIIKNVRDGLKQLKHEVKAWKEEVKERITHDPFEFINPGHVEPLWLFEEDDCLPSWKVSTDTDWGLGFSSASLERSNLGYAAFTGNLDTTVPKDGKTSRAGYCSMQSAEPRKSFQREDYYDWSLYTHLIMRVRGDGRTYRVNLASVGYFDVTWHDQWNYLLFTRGGPYWQIAKIPFSKFLLTAKGRIQDHQGPVPLDRISSLAIVCADKVSGPFRLEIDYIALQYDPSHTEKFAYEMYKVPDFTD
ncbi:complex I intermediate-associated protein 30, mitochondrial-like isoform X2 [Artemia franciscana]|nr:hypothetical protein QYM36_012325 [Artemia franciscana]KAK2711892.1 hypothetical protein QYM36_012875 [Artemia franciscana]